MPMEIEKIEVGEGTTPPPPRRAFGENCLLLVFGLVESLESEGFVDGLRGAFPGAHLIGCSTAGQIAREGVADKTPSATAVTFGKTRLRGARSEVPAMDASRSAGLSLAEDLRGPDLAYVLVLSDGVHVNGSALVQGLMEGLGPEVIVTGGLAGDGGRFTRTLVLDSSGVSERAVVAVGFYGDRLRVGHASIGGWESFGPIKRVTRSQDNVVFELDGKPALSIYESYLGADARALPASGLLFPLALVSEDQRESGLIRTLLAVDRDHGSLTFAGNVPEGGLVRLMHANFDRLVAGSGVAASEALASLGPEEPALALLISCVGRRLLMGASIDDEIEAACDKLGRGVHVTGFYSNGELSPFVPSGRCELHNQTMTITTLMELP